MNKHDTDGFIHHTAPPGPIPMEITQNEESERMLFRSRLTGIVTLIVNILLIGLATYLFIEFEIAGKSFWVTVGFVILVVCYSILSAILIYILNGSIRRSALQQEVLQSMVQNYQRRTDELQLAAQVARDASVGVDLDAVLQDAVKLVHGRFHFYHAAIYLVETINDEKYAVLRSVAGNTLGSQQMLTERYKVKVGDKSIIGYVTERAKARVVLDIQHDKQYKTLPFLPDTKSQLTVPLQIAGDVIGVFDVQSQKQGAFLQQDVMILQTLADLVAVAIKKAHLHQEIESYAQTLEERVEDRTRELVTERARLNAILDAMVEGVIYYKNNQVIYINPAFTKLMGYTDEDWEGVTLMMSVTKLTEGDINKLREVMTDDLQNKGIWRGEIPMRRKDGDEFEAYVSAATLKNENGDDDGTVFLIRDISQEKALQEQKSRFVAYASHELRTPLANMKTRLYLLNKQREEFEKHYGILQEVTGRMQRLVDALLARSRFDRGLIELNRTVVSLNDLLESVVELQRDEAAKKGISLDLTLPDHSLKSSVDKDRMIQVFTNLVSNAINYTEKSGKITVTLKEQSESQAAVLVTDTGIGIPTDLIDHIFVPFVRADNNDGKGTGLGLNITKQIVDLHEGNIEVTSEVGTGSTFTVYLPLTKTESTTVTT